jgi:NADH-quinone oxidoreductase subunit C
MTVVLTVEAEGWRAAVTQARADGAVLLEAVTAIDRIDHLEVVAVLRDPREGTRLISTRVPADAPSLPSIADVLPGANWWERETAEMFGMRYADHPDPRPLILAELPQPAGAPLRKSSPLPERVVRPWPGAATGDAARRQRRAPAVPGVRDEWRDAGASS